PARGGLQDIEFAMIRQGCASVCELPHTWKPMPMATSDARREPPGSRALPPQGPLAHAGTRGIPSDGRCRAGPLIVLGRAGDACVVGALERVSDTLYGARVYGKLGRRLAHAHAARQSCSDSLSQLVRDRWPAKSFTFTFGALELSSARTRQRRPTSET